LRSHLAEVKHGRRTSARSHTHTHPRSQPLRKASMSMRVRKRVADARSLFAWLVLICSLYTRNLPAAEADPLLTSWLNTQTNIQAWSADVIQTRTLKALTQPLIATGHVWFAQPNRFHWELREPTPTIAVRNADEMLVITPRLKRVE